jgi:hypothetical protein
MTFHPIFYLGLRLESSDRSCSREWNTFYYYSQGQLFVPSLANYLQVFKIVRFHINLLAPEFYIQILAHPVCKMWIINKPKKGNIMK